MRNIVAQIFSSNWETYKEFYQDAVVMAYAKDSIVISRDSISYKLIHLDGSTIQSQRAPSSIHSRTISVYENGNLRYIIGISNTGYDEDKKKDDIVLILMNMHWEERHFEMPILPDGFKWKLEMSTGEKSNFDNFDGANAANLMGRSIMAFTGVKKSSSRK